MSIELFELGPAVYIPYLLIILLLTFATYAAFPILFAAFRKSPITDRKFAGICYGANAAIKVIVSILAGEFGRITPYLIWTGVGLSIGRGILKKKGLWEDTAKGVKAKKATPETVCAKCGTKLSEGSEFCHNCGAHYDPHPPTTTCTNCWATPPADSETCPNCGAPLKKQ